MEGAGGLEGGAFGLGGGPLAFVASGSGITGLGFGLFSPLNPTWSIGLASMTVIMGRPFKPCFPEAIIPVFSY